MDGAIVVDRVDQAVGNPIVAAYHAGDLESLGWFLDEYCHETDSWVWAVEPTAAEVEEAQAVLSLLGTSQRRSK